MAHTTLVLGAGLGLEYGFPDGPQLLMLLKEELEDTERELRKVLDWSAGETVDSIAARRPEFADKLRTMVADILHSKEDESKLISTGKPSTYKVMIDQIGTAQAQGDTIDIITFNYDRSLPYLVHRMNEVESRKERKVSPKIIKHIYGRIAPLGFEVSSAREFDFHNYGGGDYSTGVVYLDDANDEYDDYDDDLYDTGRSNRKYEQAERVINQQYEKRIFHSESKVAFIGEIVKNPSTEIKLVLEKSDQIFFLGLAYHEANMEVLGFDFTKKYPHKMIAGTVFKMNEDVINGIKEQYPAIDCLENCDALTFLKYKFNLTDIKKNFAKKDVSILDVL